MRGIGSPYNAADRFVDEQVKNGLGSKIAIYYKDQTVTYQQLQERMNQVGNALKQLGIGMENRILLVCPDRPEFFASFLGSIKIGAVPIPVNTMMSPSDYEYFLNNSRAKAVILHEENWAKIRHLRARFVYLEHIIVICESAVIKEEDILDFHSMIEQQPTTLEAVHTESFDSAFWLYSSGSTGNPKGTIHLQHDMECAFQSFARQVLQMNEQDITFSASKLYFAYGLGNGMYFPLGAGCSTVLLDEKPTPENIFATIERYRPTIFFGVPTLYGSLLEYAERSPRSFDLSSLRICVSAGEALPGSFLRKWKQLYGVDILDGIGSTEALHIYISNTIGNVREGSTGKIVPGFEAKIVNEAGVRVPPNEIGELLIKGDSIAQGYWGLHEENKRKFNGEWYYTGDKYLMDSDGYYWYCGRSDDMMKVGGIWVSPIELENALLKHEAVLEAAVVGVKLDNDLETPKAYIVLREGYTPDEQLKAELQAFAKRELAAYKYPRMIEFIDALPKTATGKIQRFKLRTG
nr:benzoate-CoA ligase family protein [Brevibacillus fulvus]